MTTKNLTADQKLDLILEKVNVLDGKVDVLQKNQNDLITTVGEIAVLAGKTVDKLNEHCSQTDHTETVESFRSFKSGAFVA